MLEGRQPAHWARSLVCGERVLLRMVFGEVLDYASLRVVCGKFMPMQAAHTAMSPNGAIYLPNDLFYHDFSHADWLAKHLFIHECTHVWQHTLGYPVLRCGICLALQGGYVAQAAYRYRHILSTHHDIAQYNMEQQANIVADYFIGLWQTGQGDATLARVLQRFLHQPNDKTLLPQTMRVMR